MLKLVVFLGGAILMALEIVGSRVLAPSFGSSIFVWGSLISIFLTALSIGYYWGGSLADRRPRISVLGGLIAVPGVLIWSLPFYAPQVNAWVTDLSLAPRLSPLLASALLFTLPSICLGTISPYAVRLEVRSVDTVGNTAGRLYSLSTAGSIAGTLVAAFFLIPSLGVRNILHALGLLLLLLSASALISALPRRENKPHPTQRKILAKTSLITLAILVFGGFSLATPWETAPSSGVLFKKDSLYHRIVVEDHGRIRHLHFDNSRQSAMNLDDPHEQVFEYTRYLHLSRLFAPESSSAFFIGLGGGSAPKRFHSDYREMNIDVAELDPEVVRAAKQFFGMIEDERLRVYSQDGRIFLRRSDRVYDLVVIDAYFADSIPFHLTTQEFLKELRARLAPDGVVAANIIGTTAGPNSRLFRSMLKTYRSVFPQVYVFPVGPNRGVNDSFNRNIIVIATLSKERLSRQELQKRAEMMLINDELTLDIWPYAPNLIEEPIPEEDVPILTDDYAPVDSLQHF